MLFREILQANFQKLTRDFRTPVCDNFKVNDTSHPQHVQGQELAKQGWHSHS